MHNHLSLFLIALARFDYKQFATITNSGLAVDCNPFFLNLSTRAMLKYLYFKLIEKEK